MFVLVEGVDEELVESNRWFFEGKMVLVMVSIVLIYVVFYMVVLNGVLIFEMMGIEILLLLNFLLEMWNFCIIYIVGVLVLGFVFFLVWLFKD